MEAGAIHHEDVGARHGCWVGRLKNNAHVDIGFEFGFIDDLIQKAHQSFRNKSVIGFRG